MTGRRCNFSIFCNTECGFSPYFQEDQTDISIANCSKNIENHLASVGLKSDDIPTEGHLICFRVGIFSALKSYAVCPLHRYALGICWRKKAGCSHPQHSGKAKPDRAVTLDMSRAISMYDGKLVPVGSGICRKCRTVVYEQISNLHEEDIDCDASEPECIHENREKTNGGSENQASMSNSCRVDSGIGNDEYFLRDRSSESYKTITIDSQESSQGTNLSQTSNWSNEGMPVDLSTCNNVLSSLSKGEISPLKYQLQSSIETVSKTTQLYVERKADEAISAVLNAIAPGQSSILLARIFKQKADNNQGSSDNYYDEMFNSLIKLYNEADNNIVKEQLLSIMASKTTKEQLLNRIPGLTKYRVDKVRMMNFQSIYDQHDQPPVKRSRMDPVKLEHALSFFFNPAFHQIVSYGTRDIKLESGEVITVPEVVRTACHSTLIDMYNSYSEENEFTPLSRATLYNILNVCSASKRRNLHGLDNITADGHSGFELIEKLIKGIENEDIISREKKNELIQQLKSGKEYLKGDYKLHISPNSECADHCIKWGLSDPKVPNYQSKCDHDHSIKCDRCDNISSVLIKVSNLPFGSDDKTELKLALDQIENWKCHIMRTVNQDLARTDMFDNMSECQAVMVIDWAMKFLPCSHREKQSDWFGQKGLSWHVAVCIYKEKKDDQVNLKHQTFVHILESASKQDWIAVAAFIRHTLSEISVQMGHLKEVFLRSDNAGCYHCGNLWIALNCISQQTGIKIKRYDYSEAQSGKSYCDAKIAHLRQKIRMYVANGNNVTTAEEMKQAIDEGLGVAGCQVAVVDVNADQSELQKVKHKWSGINSITNLEVHEHSITQYKAYNIGNGKLVDNVNSLCSTDLSQALPNLTIIQPFTTPKAHTGNISKPKENSVQSSELASRIFVCTETGCICSFKSFSDFQRHRDFEKHVYKLEKMSTYDHIRIKWAEQCNQENIALSLSRTSVSGSSTNSPIHQGWALKKDKKVVRFSNAVKNYLENIFVEGDRTGKKANPNVVAKKMKTARNEDGERLFALEQCLQPSQIMSYFSRLALLTRTGKKVGRTVRIADAYVDDDNLVDILNDIEMDHVREQIS